MKTKERKREEIKELSKGHTISRITHQKIHIHISTPSTPTSAPITLPSKRKTKKFRKRQL